MTATKQPKESRLGRTSWILVNIGLALVVLAGLGANGIVGMKWVSSAQGSSTRGEATAAAVEAVTAFLKISPSTVDADLAHVQEVITGELLEKWLETEAEVREKVKAQSVSRISEVLKAAYAKGDSDSATILLAVDATSSWSAPVETPEGESVGKDEDEDGIPDPETDHFRVKVEMSLVDGKWLMSNLVIAS